MVIWSAVVAFVVSILFWGWSPIAAVAWSFGVACGVLNALLAMRGGERLLDQRSVAAFVFGSVLRIGVFGVVSVEFALHGPAWTMGIYFAGFFTPLGLYASAYARSLRYGLHA